MPSKFNEFMHRENIMHFERKLKTETDPEIRDLLLKLLAEERARKLSHPTDPPER
ncbi:MAG: hypothetical protein WC889_05015 [Myxococcota bacterium]|jgi:hypothetical protein